MDSAKRTASPAAIAALETADLSTVPWTAACCTIEGLIALDEIDIPERGSGCDTFDHNLGFVGFLYTLDYHPWRRFLAEVE
jgi:hypothetical protein